MMGRPRSKPIKYDGEVGLSLYGPTPSNPKFRLDYIDPLDGKRHQPRRTDQVDAFALWDETLAYLHTARSAAVAPMVRTRSGPPTVDELFEERVDRWIEDECSAHYIRTRIGRYDYRIRPVFGHQTVREWARSSDGCREVIRAARAQGLSPSTVQDLGVLMRGLVTFGRQLRWIQPGHDPMGDVKYVAKLTEEGQEVVFVRKEDRPEFGAVDKLILAYDELAEETGIDWLGDRAVLGAYGGLRPGERDAVRLCDLRPDELAVMVEGSFSWPRRSDESGRELPKDDERAVVSPIRKLPKNGKRRLVLLPGSSIERLVDLADRRRAAGAANDALLFEDPKRPGLPISEAKTRQLHIAAGLRAGWETVEVRRRAESRRHLGPDLRPRHTNYSLRHHAAAWMHDVAGFDWTDVSRALGHANVAFTLAVYVRSGAEADERNRARLVGM